MAIPYGNVLHCDAVGDCTTGIPFGHHVGLRPPRNDEEIVTKNLPLGQFPIRQYEKNTGIGQLPSGVR